MVEIRYGDQYEVADLAGLTVSEAREQFRNAFGIPDKARAKLNGSKVKWSAELDTEINDGDKLSFAVARSRVPYMVGTLLLALAITGGVFAYGWINASITLGSAAATNDFAIVTVNSTTPVTWNPYGSYKGSITTLTNGTPIFNVNTSSSNYAGDLVVTVSLANGDTLAKCYRVLALKLAIYNSANAAVDINGSGGAGDANDYVLLTLDNGAVSMFPGGSSDNFTVRALSGFYITHIFKSANWATASAYQPLLFCEVAQR